MGRDIDTCSGASVAYNSRRNAFRFCVVALDDASAYYALAKLLGGLSLAYFRKVEVAVLSAEC
eukprot:6184354-Pleurochrysis_carterae.AAC.1